MASLSSQAADIAAAVQKLETSPDQVSRAERLRLIQSLEKLKLELKDPKEAIFDHLTNV